MKLGFSTVACPNWTLQRISDAAKQYGFDGVELRVDADNRHLSPYVTLKNADLIGRVFKREGTPIFSLKSGIPISFHERAGTVEARDEILNIIKLAEVMEVPFVRITLADGANEKSIHCHEARISVLKLLAETAIKRGVKLAIETKNGWSSAASLWPVLERIGGTEGIGIIYNIFNCFNGGRESWIDSYNALKPYICYCKMSDRYNSNADGSARYCLLGGGELPIRRILRRFKLDAYKGYFSFDWNLMCHPKLDPAEQAFPHFVQTMKSMWALEDCTPS